MSIEQASAGVEKTAATGANNSSAVQEVYNQGGREVAARFDAVDTAEKQDNAIAFMKELFGMNPADLTGIVKAAAKSEDKAAGMNFQNMKFKDNGDLAELELTSPYNLQGAKEKSLISMKKGPGDSVLAHSKPAPKDFTRAQIA